MNTSLLQAGIGEDSAAFYQGPIAHLMVLAHFVQKTTRQKLSQDPASDRSNLAHDACISLLAQQDCSPGELAATLGISKQACSKTIRELEDQGLLARRQNPADSRSSVLSLTVTGRQRQQDSHEVTREVYQRFATDVGGERLRRLVEILEKLRGHLGVELSSAAAGRLSNNNGSTSLNLLLSGFNNHFRQTLMTSLGDRGFASLKQSYGEVLGLLNREQRRIQYIASVIGVSKQAIAAIAADLEQAGYITRDPDPVDRRQVILRLTPQGEELLRESTASVRDLEASIREILGENDFRLMDDTLHAMYLQVAEHYDVTSVLPAKIQRISEYLLAELGVAGVRSLTQHLMTITRGK